MNTQYHCQNPKRLQAVRLHPTLNAIDYLEVLDGDAPPDSPSQRTLLVYCLKPLLSLTKDNVQIEGGVRITPVKAEWAFPATAVPASLLTPAEQIYLAALPNPDHILVIRTDSSGDFSTYTLRLVSSITDTNPPTDFDPLLSQVAFSFKVECPSDFDCKTAVSCPPDPLPQPRIDYLAKDYASFRRLMLDRLSVLMPEWQERNPADIGVALVETMAYAADYLSYYQDAIATEAYLGTARKRTSVRRHARLLDYPMHEGCNARTWVVLQVAPLGAADGGTLPARTPLYTQTGAERGTITPADLDKGLKAGAQIFETMHDLTLRSALNELHFYTWGDDRCCLPAGATRATLQGSLAQVPLAAGDLIAFEEVRGPDTGEAGDADWAHRHVVRLLNDPIERIDPLTNEMVLDIAWDAADALPFPLCLWQLDAGPVSVARGNVVLADAGTTIANEPLLPGAVPANGRYLPQLRTSHITYRVPYHHLAAQKQAAAYALSQTPTAALPDATLLADGLPWHPQANLLHSDRFDRDFMVEVDENGRSHIRFGDGTLGQQPKPGQIFTATYRVGGGPASNVGAEAIAHIAQDGIQNVRNLLPAQGGTSPEPISQVKLYAPQAFRTQERAVTEADYATIAQRHPQVQKAVATLRWTGSWHTMFVTVDRIGGQRVDADFEEELRLFIEQFRLAGHDVEIEPPRFVPLDIALTVCVCPGYFRYTVQQALLQLFSSRPLPTGGRGFFHPDNFTFGQPVYLSQVVAAAMQVPGVSWVEVDDSPPKPNRFRRWGQPAYGEIADGRIQMSRLEIARLDNDPNAPENGRIEFMMQGGL